MAELSVAASARVVVSEQDTLLATKLYVPGLQPGFVPRPRLVEALGDGLARRLILVCAPAGFGKTAVLADWFRPGDRWVAWLSLDAADNDPARFWRHAVAALDRARPGIAERVAPLLGQPRSSFERLVTALINELAAQPGEDELLLVLDDYHLVSSELVHASVGFLLEHRPPELHLVLASRSDPPLPLARLRGRGQLAELRATELRFTFEEAAALLREAAGPACPMRSRRPWRPAPKGWPRGCSWPPCRCGGRPMRPGLWRLSAAATGTCWTTWPMRCLRARPSRCCAALILRMSVTLILGTSWLWKTPPGGARRGWVVLGVSRWCSGCRGDFGDRGAGGGLVGDGVPGGAGGDE